MATYRLFGDFWLSSPALYLDATALDLLRRLEPYLQQFDFSVEEASSPNGLNFDILKEFPYFQEIESRLWEPPRPREELVPPSGTMNWPIAHHLHNPSFVTFTPYNGETMDNTNPCIWLIMANSFVPGKTFIFDHLARREAVDGLAAYPKPILECHEQWMAQLRKHSAAKVEIIYGRAVGKRMIQTHNLQSLQLWGEYRDITLYLEWDDDLGQRTIHRIIIFVMHPQLFLMPWGKRWARSQDQAIWIGHKLARLNCHRDFYQRIHWSIINRFPRLQRYPKFKTLAKASLQAVTNTRDRPRRSLLENLPGSQRWRKPGAWSAPEATKRLLASNDFNSFLYTDASTSSTIDHIPSLTPTLGISESTVFDRSEQIRGGSEETIEAIQLNETQPARRTRIAEFIGTDPRKPSSIGVKCKTCGKVSVDNNPRWHKISGKYIAKQKRCSVPGVHKAAAIPFDDQIAYVTYAAVATGISRVGKPYFRPLGRTGEVPPFTAAGADSVD